MTDKPTEDGWRPINPGFPKPTKPSKEDDASRTRQDAERKIWRSFGN